jgi:hypothetical protein
MKVSLIIPMVQNRADVYGNEVAWQARNTLATNIESLSALDESASSSYEDMLDYMVSQIIHEDLKCGFVNLFLQLKGSSLLVALSGTP